MEKPPAAKRSIEAAGRKLEKKAIFAYNTNLDSVIEIGLPEAKLVSDYLPGLLGCMKKGEGSEIRIGEKEFRKVEELLPPGSLRIGGPAGIMALDSARLGVQAYMHAASKSRKLLSLFKSKRVLVATNTGFAEARECGDDSDPLVHLIFEFKKGPGIGSSNRFIASCENTNPSLFIDPLFSRKIKEELPGIFRGVIAGFNLLPPEIFKARKDEVVRQISEWKRINPNLKLHLEWGSFISSETEMLTLKHVLPLVDCVAFNEDEFPSAMKALGAKRHFKEADSILERAKTTVIHTRNWSMVFSKEFSSKSLSDSLAFASCVAGFKAAKGRAPTLAELRKERFRWNNATLSHIDEKKLSEKGISFAFCPSVEIVPKFTVGLGDCFSAAFFLTLK
jgi:ADP-dependent phosphofructokinase/glucokinase